MKRVAFIGLGKMGAGMASNILEAGFCLSVYNRTVSKMKPLVDKGATAASTPREAAINADVAITCLFDDQSVLDVVNGEDGLLAGLKQGSIHIGTTTVSPKLAGKLAELHRKRGTSYVAAPIGGRPDAAEAGRLRTFVAGNPEDIEKCKPLFAAYTTAIINMGEDHSLANSMKLCLNYTAVSIIELMSHVYAFADKSGLDLTLVNEMFHGIFANPELQMYAAKIRKRNFDKSGFDLMAGLKDVQLMLEASTDIHAALSYANIIKDKLLLAVSNGMQRKDWSAIYEISRLQAGLE
jgi:3-hydroxyisobutyrate dehydrogenase-like beta-hydroxyacid dehydrogenase